MIRTVWNLLLDLLDRALTLDETPESKAARIATERTWES